MSDNPIKELDGKNGQLHVYSNKVVIKRKGFLSKILHGFFKGEKTIYIDRITGIQVKKAGLLTSGYIQFTIGGGNESEQGIMDATKDENTVMFKRGQNDLVEEIKNYIEKQIHSSSQKEEKDKSLADDLRELKDLVDEGILTEEEFKEKKKELLKN